MRRIVVCLVGVLLLFPKSYGQINWTKDTLNNPILMRGPNGSWDDELIARLYTIFDGSVYHGWYAGYDGNNTRIGYASSPDGISWTKHPAPVLDHGQSGSWDELVVYQPSVMFDGTTYRMWFGGHNGPNNRQIGYATSPDSINWTKYGSNPVLSPGPPGSWDDEYVDSPWVIFIKGKYHMWYTGSNGSVVQSGHATSLDGIIWEKDTLNPILPAGEAGSWDEGGAYQPCVLIGNDSTYHMFYSGGGYLQWKIGYAYSSDGQNWTKYSGNPVMQHGSGGSWDNAFVGLCTVSFNQDSTLFKMWYTGANLNSVNNWDIGYAAAPLIPIGVVNLYPIKYPVNPVFRRGSIGNWDSNNALAPSILYDGTMYRMWYGGYGGGVGSHIGYAYSADGISWTRNPDPVVPQGPSGSWYDHTSFQPSVLFDSDSNQYKMWFCGHDGNFDNRKIGYATSHDTIQWTVYGSDPLLTPGPSGSWDNLSVGAPNVLFIDGVYHMWYGGSDGSYTQIGHATSLDGITWEKDTLNPVLRVGSVGSWDDKTVDGPAVLFDGDIYHMWYSGGKQNAWDWKTGYAYSYDGRNWIKYSVDNPVLGLGEPGSWDDTYVGAGGNAVMFFLDASGHRKLKMWYGGGYVAAEFGDIGYAATDTSAFILSVEENYFNVVPNSFSLFQNYPNPFNPTTKIRYQVQSRGHVALLIYNVLGQIVETLVNEEKPAGTYELTWNAEKLSSGIYFYRLQTSKFTETKKMILLK